MRAPELPPLEYVEWERPPELAHLPIPDDYVRPSVGDIAVFKNENKLFVPPHSLILRGIAEAVTDEDITSGRLAEWHTTLEQARIVGNRKRMLAGIAGPQVGINKRVVIANLNENANFSPTSTDTLTLLVNPTFEPKGHAKCIGGEGCYSCLKAGGPVLRFKQGWVHADNLDEPILLEDDPSDMFSIRARTIQHEVVDHLGCPETRQGAIRVPDRIIKSIEAGELPEDSLSWAHSEYVGKDKPFTQRIGAMRAGEKVGPNPFAMPHEQWVEIAAGRILIPRLIAA